MSKKNREKGRRIEYLVRDILREEGYIAHRVPMSGAAAGFKGDIHFKDGDKTYLVEVKSRVEEFTNIFNYCEEIVGNFDLKNPARGKLEYKLPYGGKAIMTFDMHHMLDSTPPRWLGRSDTKVSAKLHAIEHWGEECHFMALHMNRKPVIFLRYVHDGD